MPYRRHSGLTSLFFSRLSLPGPLADTEALLRNSLLAVSKKKHSTVRSKRSSSGTTSHSLALENWRSALLPLPGGVSGPRESALFAIANIQTCLQIYKRELGKESLRYLTG
jgi:hypothetical protein